MNPQEILEAARRAIEAGESPDDVARWIEESTGISLVGMASGFEGAGAGRSWEPSPAGRLDEHTRSFGLDPNMSAKEFGDMAAGSVQTALGGRLAQQGLGAAVGAIRTARAARAAPLAAGALPSEYGATVSLATPASRRTALDALRAFVRHPVVKGVRSALPWGGLGYLLNERR